MNDTVEVEIEAEEKLYDLRQLQVIAEGNQEFLMLLAGIYLTTIPANSEQMVQAALAENWLLVSELAHKIKPTLDSMNIMSIRSDIRTLEIDAKNKVNTHLLTKIAEKVNAVINGVARQLKYEYNL